MQRYLLIVGLSLATSYIQAFDADLSELAALEQPSLVIDAQTRALCTTLAEIYEQLERRPLQALQDIIETDTEEVAYTTLLRIIKTCLQATWPHDEHWETLRYELLELYDELLQDYADAIEQPGTRRIKPNSVMSRCKILTNELVAAFAQIQNLRVTTITADQQTIIGPLVLDSLQGVVHANSGVLSAGPVVNADLANNSVNTNNLAPMSVTGAQLAFESIQVSSVPSSPSLLLMYRGTITANGVVLSGDNITVNHGSPGVYTINLNGQTYADLNYQIIVQAYDETVASAAILTAISTTQFTVTWYSPILDTPTNAQFAFITLGAPA